ncbi:hypothetical protein, partial [Bacillus thuringiensis]|uniref:hypothetical protein n=1 Tax=Bacillus thuringiensis TaxID=1428 RepID=UPI001C5542E9
TYSLESRAKKFSGSIDERDGSVSFYSMDNIHVVDSMDKVNVATVCKCLFSKKFSTLYLIK